MNFNYFARQIKGQLLSALQEPEAEEQLEEIRLRTNKPIVLQYANRQEILPYQPTREDIIETLERMCENSIYSYQNQLCQGYITLREGNRVGVVGNAVMKEGNITNLNYISSLNIRMHRQIWGCSTRIMGEIIRPEENSIYNTLIISVPGAGKTTLLKDMVRKISNGFTYEENGVTKPFEGLTVAVVDERGEIAAMNRGHMQNDLGIRTDVLDNVPKAIGMKMMIRSMAPQVLVADEIGGEEDIQAIRYALCCGVKGIFTAHAASMEDVEKNRALYPLIEDNLIERVVCISKNREYTVLK